MTAQRTRLSLLPTTLLAIALSILGAEHGARAVTTEPLVVETSADFLRGELDGTAVTSTGEVRTSVGEERFPIADASVAYALARGRDGSIYVGTGTDGKIFRLRGRELAPFATTGQLVVSSLAVGADGTLYAGTLPEGRIFAIAADGTSRELARPEGAEHVWALVHDARRDRLFAATGPHGKVFAIDRTGRAAVFYAGEDAQAHLAELPPEHRMSCAAHQRRAPEIAVLEGGAISVENGLSHVVLVPAHVLQRLHALLAAPGHPLCRQGLEVGVPIGKAGVEAAHRHAGRRDDVIDGDVIPGMARQQLPAGGQQCVACLAAARLLGRQRLRQCRTRIFLTHNMNAC